MSNEKKKSAEQSRDTCSETYNEAYNKAKKANNVMQGSPPSARRQVPEIRAGSPTGRMLTEEDYPTRDGGSVTFRDDRATTYPDGGKQGDHINAGPTGEKLKQHHNYKTKKC